MPYPDGINVSLNGAYLDFGGTAPLAASGCTMVPFRAFLEGLGAEVAFDGSRIAAALENGDSLELVLGATELTVTQGGRITTLDMGAAPFCTGWAHLHPRPGRGGGTGAGRILGRYL